MLFISTHYLQAHFFIHSDLHAKICLFCCPLPLCGFFNTTSPPILRSPRICLTAPIYLTSCYAQQISTSHVFLNSLALTFHRLFLYTVSYFSLCTRSFSRSRLCLCVWERGKATEDYFWIGICICIWFGESYQKRQILGIGILDWVRGGPIIDFSITSFKSWLR